MVYLFLWLDIWIYGDFLIIKMATGESENTWTVVKFIDDNTVNVVPTSWIHDEVQCYWPHLPANKVTQAIKSGILNTHWPSHKVTIFRNATYGNFF